MKKRIVSLLLALVMMTSLLPVQVFAADADDAAEQPVVEQQQEESRKKPRRRSLSSRSPSPLNRRTRPCRWRMMEL